jgi:hypothetical protein
VRTAAVSIQSAEAIAQAAESFGQDDDITVLQLIRQSWIAWATKIPRRLQAQELQPPVLSDKPTCRF